MNYLLTLRSDVVLPIAIFVLIKTANANLTARVQTLDVNYWEL